MALYAIKIQKSNADLLTLLNGGLTPELHRKDTFLIFDATWNSEVPNEIVTVRQMARDYPDISHFSPLIFKFNKGKK